MTTAYTQSAFGYGAETMEPNKFKLKVPYATLATMTAAPAVGMTVLNPASGPFQAAMLAFDKGYLNPSQPNYPANYYTISTAYGKEPTGNLYASRGCANNKITQLS